MANARLRILGGVGTLVLLVSIIGGRQVSPPEGLRPIPIRRWTPTAGSVQPFDPPTCGSAIRQQMTSYGQKTQTRLNSRVYDPVIAYAAACILLTSSGILDAK
jgi:hypothetical protein